MDMALPAPVGMTLAEYQEWEPKQELRYEFIGGEIYAMTGARRVHNIVSGNVFSLLRQVLRGTPCRPYTSDMRLHVQATEANFYPDVVVSCHPEDAQAELSLSHPRLIVEVLSPSTEAHDRGTKFAHYRQIEDLQEYLLIDPDKRSVELLRRAEAGTWVWSDHSQAQHMNLCDEALSVPAFFEDLPAPGAEAPKA